MEAWCDEAHCEGDWCTQVSFNKWVNYSDPPIVDVGG